LRELEVFRKASTDGSIWALNFFVVVNAMLDSQLITLLIENRDNPLVADCLERTSQTDEVWHKGDGLVPLNHIIDVYSVRERINSELNNGVVEGFDDLLPALKAASVQSVKVHPLEFVSHWYVIFTDESSTELFGILKSRKKSAAWFNPVNGHEG
jgi:hypothetical protein